LRQTLRSRLRAGAEPTAHLQPPASLFTETPYRDEALTAVETDGGGAYLIDFEREPACVRRPYPRDALTQQTAPKAAPPFGGMDGD